MFIGIQLSEFTQSEESMCVTSFQLKKPTPSTSSVSSLQSQTFPPPQG